MTREWMIRYVIKHPKMREFALISFGVPPLPEVGGVITLRFPRAVTREVRREKNPPQSRKEMHDQRVARARDGEAARDEEPAPEVVYDEVVDLVAGDHQFKVLRAFELIEVKMVPDSSNIAMRYWEVHAAPSDRIDGRGRVEPKKMVR